MVKEAIALFAALSIAVACSACSAQDNNNNSNTRANDAESTSASESEATTTIEYKGLILQIPEDWNITDQGDDYIYWDCNGEETAVFSIGSVDYSELPGTPYGEGMVRMAASDQQEENDVVQGTFSKESVYKGGLPAMKVSFTIENDSTNAYVTQLYISTSQALILIHGEALPSVYSEFEDSFAAVFDSVEPQSGEAAALKELEGNSSSDADSNSDSSTEESSDANSQALQAGTYKVGIDCPAGEYKLTASGHGYFCVYPDTTKSDILENSNFDKCEYITVEEGQCLEVKNATFITLENAEPSTGTLSGSGRYLVGFDCPAGEYTLTQTGANPGYYCINDNSTVNASIVQNNNFEGNDYCTVVDGQYLTLSRCTAELN